MSSILLAPQPLLDLRQVVAHLAVEIEEPCRADVALPFGQVPLAEVDPPQRVPEGPQADDRGGVPRSDVIKTQVTKAGGPRDAAAVISLGAFWDTLGWVYFRQ